MLAKVEDELAAFSQVVKKSPAFASFLADPTIPRNEKTAKVYSLISILIIADLITKSRCLICFLKEKSPIKRAISSSHSQQMVVLAKRIMYDALLFMLVFY
jgi:hypothetical protein